MKKTAVICIAVLWIGSFLAGCSKEAEQTNTELTVYIGDDGSGMLKTAVGIFEDQYPEVQVNIINGETSSPEESYDEAKRTEAELMSGKGADVFLIKGSWDLDKMIRGHAFADLSDFFDQDDYFRSDIWQQKILEGGVQGDYRFAIPVEYKIPILVTSAAALEESGIKTENIKDFGSFMEETEQYMTRVQGKEGARRLFRMNLVPRQCLSWAGYSVLDWENESVDLEQDELKRFFEWYRQVEQQSEEDYYFDSFKGAAAIRDGKVLFENQLNAFSFRVVGELNRQIDSFDTTVMIPVRNLEGSITATIGDSLAVSANSANKLNAYRFIQIYMSTEVQTSIAARQSGDYKVNKEAQIIIYDIEKANHYANAPDDFPEELPPFSEEAYKELMGYVEEVGRVIYAPQWQERLRSAMMPYLTGELTYEDAALQAKEELEIYVSE